MPSTQCEKPKRSWHWLCGLKTWGFEYLKVIRNWLSTHICQQMSNCLNFGLFFMNHTNETQNQRQKGQTTFFHLFPFK